MAIAYASPIVVRDMKHIHKQAQKELEALSDNRLLLTGAGGFLGYYFILSILAWNDVHPKKAIRLTAVSRFRSGIPDWLSSIGKRKDLLILSRDVTKESFMDEGPYDYMIHAASFASPMVYRQFPLETMNANVLGLYAILNQVIHARKSGKKVKKLLYFSSSEIYGDPTKGNIPTPETYRGNVSCTGPRACYDESKRFCETLCVNYAHVYKLPIVSVRPFNNYGPGMKITDGRVVADFARNILANEDIVMYSSGSPSRTFCYVADAIVGYIKALVHGAPGEAYNIGVDGPETSMDSLASHMVSIGKKHFGYTGSIRKKLSKDKEYLTDNPQRRCPSIDKAKKALGYSPTISLKEGLYRTLLWYTSQIKTS